MRVWLTPADRDGCRWRIEIWPSGLVRVWQIVAGWVGSSPLREVRDIRALGEWLVERGIDPDLLVEA